MIKRFILKETLFALILAVVLVFLYILEKKTPYYHDLTRDQHALSPTTLSLLKQFTQPVQLTLYTENPDLYHSLQLLIERYQRQQKQLTFQWEQRLFVHDNQSSRQLLVLKYQDHEHLIGLDDKIL